MLRNFIVGFADCGVDIGFTFQPDVKILFAEGVQLGWSLANVVKNIDKILTKMHLVTNEQKLENYTIH